ncbi:hypothetical protein [Glutamicibacter sp. NPDC087344]|uniref:hypothetical protein n=1 Tax=Glutamicibacter sp. NPDC087344 TaxID=3363994 RepID=UPI00381FEFD3
MRKVLSSAAVLLFLSVAATGCANFDAAATSPVSDACSAAIQSQNEAWSDTDSTNEQLQAAELTGLQECKNIDEWSTAVSYNPGSMGYDVLSTEEAANLVYMACESGDVENLTPVCADAAGRGYLN